MTRDKIRETNDFRMISLNNTNDKDFEMIYRTHGKDLYKFLFRLAGNSQDAEDLVQETFLVVMKKLPFFRGESSIKTWIYSIAVNKFRDALRHKKVWRQNAVLGDETAASDNPLGTLLNSEMRRRIRKAFDELPAQFMEALTLVRFEGMSYRDATQVIGTTSDSIRMRVHRAHLMLAAQLRD